MINLNNLSVPVGWELSEVGQSYIICNHLREPISTTIRQGMQGIYPYYGPTGVLDHLDHYRVEGKYALIGEDGDHFLKYDNRPMTLLVNGKFNVNNHAHLVQGIKHSTTEWFYYFFMHTSIKPFLTRQGAGRFKLNKAALENLPILIPPIEEQRKIAEILSTWDEAIRLTQALIAGKQQRKKGLMQRLLAGQVRFPGFAQQQGTKDSDFGQIPLDWTYKALGSLGTTYTGLSGKNKEHFGSGKPFIPYKNIFDNPRIDPARLDFVEVHDGERQSQVKFGDLFFTTSSETPDEVGMSSVLLDAIENCYLNSFCFGFRLHNFDILLPEYAQFFFRSELFRKQMHKLAQGATRYNLSKYEMLKSVVLLPSLSEQRRIAAVLQACDREIQLLQQKLAALQQQKKGLMQRLLTGEVRVVPPVSGKGQTAPK